MKKWLIFALTLTLMASLGASALAVQGSAAETCGDCGNISFLPNPVQLSLNPAITDPKLQEHFNRTVIVNGLNPYATDKGSWSIPSNLKDFIAFKVDDDGNCVLIPLRPLPAGMSPAAITYTCPHGVQFQVNCTISNTNIVPTVKVEPDKKPKDSVVLKGDDELG